MYKGEQLAECLNIFGLPCEFGKVAQAPKLTTYFLNIQAGNITPSKIKNAVYNLSLHANENFTISNNCDSNYNLTLTVSENNYNLGIENIARPKQNSLEFAAGEDTFGNAVFSSVLDMPHGLIAGTTGSGKTVFLKTLLYQLSAYNHPNLLKYAIIDKKSELSQFWKCDNCIGFADDTQGAKNSINWLVKEMRSRYAKMKVLKTNTSRGYFPDIILIIDELADLLTGTDKAFFNDQLLTLAAVGRAAGIHIICATQTPRASILNGALLANLPTRFIFKTVSSRESVLCLGHKGAEDLNGGGVMIYQHNGIEKRLQAPFMSQEQLNYIFR